jgi:hypothetical protein
VGPLPLSARQPSQAASGYTTGPPQTPRASSPTDQVVALNHRTSSFLHASQTHETMRIPKTTDATPSSGVPWFARFNTAVSVGVTKVVGTMWCAYAFAVLAFVSLPSAIRSGNVVTLVSWISQTFLQLVLLSIIIVGQNILGAAADMRAEATYQDADAVLRTSLEIQRHLAAQDMEIERILSEVGHLNSHKLD